MASHIVLLLLSKPASTMALADDLTLLEALSGVAGSISLVSWIVLLLPQLIENYKNGRADALSLGFLGAWLVGDITNLIGAAWGGLLPTVIALAVYFCFADIVLMGQTLYYNHITARDANAAERRASTNNENDPRQPLISGRRRSSVISKHRRNSALRGDSLSGLLRKDEPYAAFARNTFSILAVCAAGTLGWFAAYKSGAWKGQVAAPREDTMPLGANILGYISAFLYLVARLPQIYQNYTKKSCDGLSLLFFLLSILGNLTYGAGILLHSTERSYVLDNLPWLMGSIGTMAEDFFIFFQFHLYSGSSSAVDVENDDHPSS